MGEMQSCEQCGAPAPFRACTSDDAALERVLLGNRVDLMRCGNCGALWCVGAYRSGVRARAWVLWTHAPRDWQRAYDLDDGVSLARWHARQVKAQGCSLPHPCGRGTCRFGQRAAVRGGDLEAGN